jgi:hypothetical protein
MATPNTPDEAQINKFADELINEVGGDKAEAGFGHLDISQDELDECIEHNFGSQSNSQSDDFGFDEENYHY